jgi:hypothetical protein
MADETTPILEAGPHENSLSPGGGTAHADLKTNTIAAIVAALGTMSDEDLNGFRKSLIPPQPVTGGNATNLASIKSSGALKEAVKDDLAKVFGAEATLSEGFIDSATTLFEAAIETRVAIQLEEIEAQYDVRLNEANEDFITKSSERLDSYLDYFASTFMEANQVAIDNGIRLELAESLLSGLGNLFMEHNVKIDAEQVDVVKALEEQVEELSARLNEAVDANATVAAEIEAREISNVVNKLSEGMIDADAARLAVVAESVDYNDAADFEAKLALIKGTLFEAASITNDNNGLVLEEVQPIDATGLIKEETVVAPVATANPSMKGVMDAISRGVSRG